MAAEASAGAGTGAGAGAGTERAAKQYKFYPEDFTKPPVKPLHLDLTIDVTVERLQVTLFGTYRNDTAAAVTEVTLDAQDLEVVSVAQVTEVGVACDLDAKNFVAHVASFGATTDVGHALDKDNNKLTITLANAVAPGEQTVIRTVTNAVPTEHVLEGTLPPVARRIATRR